MRSTELALVQIQGPSQVDFINKLFIKLFYAPNAEKYGQMADLLSICILLTYLTRFSLIRYIV